MVEKEVMHLELLDAEGHLSDSELGQLQTCHNLHSAVLRKDKGLELDPKLRMWPTKKAK